MFQFVEHVENARLFGDLLEPELAERIERGRHQAGLFALAAEGDDQLLRASPGLAEGFVE